MSYKRTSIIRTKHKTRWYSKCLVASLQHLDMPCTLWSEQLQLQTTALTSVHQLDEIPGETNLIGPRILGVIWSPDETDRDRDPPSCSFVLFFLAPSSPPLTKSIHLVQLSSVAWTSFAAIIRLPVYFCSSLARSLPVIVL